MEFERRIKNIKRHICIHDDEFLDRVFGWGAEKS
jgi:hypothetical protein